MRTQHTTLRQTPSLYSKIALGVELHRWQAYMIDAPAQHKVLNCGRRFGKTMGMAADAIWFADTKDQTEQLVIAPTADQSRIITSYIITMIERGPRYIQSRVDQILRSPFPEIRFRNGSRIHARPAGTDGRFLRGFGADRVLRDEDAFIPDAVCEEVLPPMLANSTIAEDVRISTPFGMNHFYEDYNRAKLGEPGWQSFRFPSRLSPYVQRSYLANQKRSLTAIAYAVEYDARFREDQNVVFPWSKVLACLDDFLVPTPLDGHEYVVGWDPAKYHDRSGVAVLDVTDPEHVALILILDIGGRDYTPQLQEVEALCELYNGAALIFDATHTDMLRENVSRSAVGIDFTNALKEEMINALLLRIEQRTITLPNHDAFKRELHYYRYELTRSHNVTLGAPEKAGHYDDLVTAAALANWLPRIRAPKARIRKR